MQMTSDMADPSGSEEHWYTSLLMFENSAVFSPFCSGPSNI